MSFVMKLLRLFALVLLATSCGRASAGLFISEYVEGSSNNKAIEIFNPGSTTINLSGFSLKFFSNGNTSASTTISLSGDLAGGDVFVVADVDSAAEILSAADLTSASSFFNGDDAVALLDGSSNFLDVIGQIGVDPGSQWGSGLVSTQNNTLRRKSSVLMGDSNGSDAFDPSLEWVGFAQDTFDGLGSHAVTLAPVPEPSSLAIFGAMVGGLFVRRRRR